MLLITGITGHSGKYFLNELVRHNYSGRIRVIIRNKESIELIEKTGLNIEIIVGELTDEVFLRNALVNVDTLFHIASIFYSENVVEAGVLNRVKRIILVHTTGIYSKFKSASQEYQTIEKNVDRFIKNANYEIDFTILRPTMIFGYLNDRNIIKFIKMVDNLPILPVIDHGKSLIQPVHGKDLGEAYFQVLLTTEIDKDYILSGEMALSMYELFSLISAYLDKKRFIVSIPGWMGVSFARLLKFFSLKRIDYVERVQRMSENRNFSHEHASNDFNYLPGPFKENLRKEVQLYLNSKGNKQ